ncbi:MAG: hypothetical protein K2M00_01105 [Muribaculaceae bacterium]|nr:hypothetical protein [Muribaculaceae bacterium]
MKQLPQHGENTQWEGYTMDALLYKRAVTLAHIQLEKERLTMDGSRLRRGNLFFSQSVFSRIMSMIGYTDYLVIGVKLWQKIAPLFKRNKDAE